MTSSKNKRTQNRLLHINVQKKKNRKPSSLKWLQRQLNDPYVIGAQEMGYRSRAAFKLIQLNEKFQFLKKADKIIDLGCAPGGWLQVLSEMRADGKIKASTIIGVDLLAVPDLGQSTHILKGDFTDETIKDKIRELACGKVDIILSDMAPSTTGHQSTDHLKIMMLAEEVFYFAKEMLNPGGHMIVKVFQGGAEKELLTQIKNHFKIVKHAKPDSSRKDSSETYLVALDFKSPSDKEEAE